MCMRVILGESHLGLSTLSITLLPRGKYPVSSFGSYQPQPCDSSSEGSALQTADPLALAQGKVASQYIQS